MIYAFAMCNRISLLHVFRRIDTKYDTIYTITIPTHEPIKKVYVEMVKKVVMEEEDNNDEED